MQPLLTVIIPMYGVEKFIAKCLDSITAQSYKNLEILCVNDGTKDRAAEIAEEYAKADERVRVINNPQNLGLFRARVEGLKVAKGEYIAFVDADDFIGIDWFRLLMKKITAEGADMVIGNTVNVDENGYAYYYNNYRKLTTSHDTIEGDDVLRTLYEQEGGCFVWHTVWNKVYSAELIKKCMPYLLRVDFHMIMGEDIAFSSVFYTHARKLCFADADCYFYYRHSEASTSLSLPKEKIIKNIYDLGTVFQFAESCLESYDKELYEQYKPLIANFKSRYQRIWRGNIWSAKINEDPLALDAMESTFGVRDGELPRPHDFYFYELTTPWSGRYEEIKKAIAYSEHKVISFDIFDTLVKRPFYEPTDLFLVVGEEAKKRIPYLSAEAFAGMRREAENAARRSCKLDDVTLTEIYESFEKEYGISREDCDFLKKLEEDAEVKYCTARIAAKDLFELALAEGKRVIITSDMYLERPTVERILKKNGYEGYEKLFLSSETRLLKADGKMFKLVCQELDESAEHIFHIGDSWSSDILAAQGAGLHTAFFPKCTETFENGISDIYTGPGATPFKQRRFTEKDSAAAMSQLPMRCAAATVAGKLFDNPFEIFQEKSSFNGDSYRMGYYGLGMHVLGIASWIRKTALEAGYEKIVFLARDGKMVKEAFDYLCEKTGTDIKSEYFYATRKTLLPYSISRAEDFFELGKIIDIKAHTPRGVLQMFDDILFNLDEKMENEYKKAGVELDENIDTNARLFNFVRALIKISYNDYARAELFEKAQEAFRGVFNERTATFDVGYSGRLQKIISSLAGCPVDAFFIHTNGYNTDKEVNGLFKIHSFYDYTPTITGIIREYFISDPTPSAYAYKIEDGKIEALIEPASEGTASDCVFAVLEMQKAALDFCRDYIDTFSDMPEYFAARRNDLSSPLEYLLLHATEFDRYTFTNSVIEDEIYSGYTARNLFETWTWHLSVLSGEGGACVSAYLPTDEVIVISGAGKLKKAITYLLYDRKTFKEKFKFKFRKHKIFLFFCGVLYSIPRFFYRLARRIFRRK